MTQRNVCLPMCEYFEDAECTKRTKGENYGGDPDFRPCPFNIGFEVLDKKQWAAVEVLRKMIPSDTLRPTRDDAQYLNRAVAAFDESEKERK